MRTNYELPAYHRLRNTGIVYICKYAVRINISNNIILGTYGIHIELRIIQKLS